MAKPTRPAAGVTQAPAAPPQPVERWAYLCRHEAADRVDAVLSSAGGDGWELVCFSAGAYWDLVFKRRLP